MPIVSPKIILARHLVALPFAMLFAPYESYWLGWAVSIMMSITVAAVITGLALLFFTNHQRGKSLGMFVTTLWVVGFCIVVGNWMQIWPPAKYLPWVALVAFIAAKARARHLVSRTEKRP